MGRRTLALAALLLALAPAVAHAQAGVTYSIPSGNPYAGVPGAAPEVWSSGLRNPFRFSFDRATGALTVGDVGGTSREELNHLARGGARGRNFGWPCREGRTAGPVSCGVANPVEPIFDYENPAGAGTLRAITAGHVVRDASLTGLVGRILYADFYVGDIRSVTTSGGGDASTGASILGLASFGEDALGRLYAVDLIGGRLLRLVAGPSPGSLATQELGGAFQSPISVAAPLGDASRLFVVERAGRVRLLKNGVQAARPFLDISPLVSTNGEGGLLSIAFAPDYAWSGAFYAFYTDAEPGDAGDLRIEEFRRSAANPDVADPASRRTVLTIEHSASPNHNGGQLAFGPDGLLYIATGDGARGSNPLLTSQGAGSLLGKLLRIDPRGARPAAPRPPALDRRAPRLRRRVPARQRLLRHRFVWVYARCDERCTVTASARLMIGRLSYALTRARRNGRAGQRLLLKPRLTRRATTALRRTLRRRRRPAVRVYVTLYARDRAGNETRRTRHVVVVRR